MDQDCKFLDTNCILQTLLDVKGTVFSTTTTSTASRRCHHPYSLTQVYAAFMQYMQLFGRERKRTGGGTHIKLSAGVIISPRRKNYPRGARGKISKHFLEKVSQCRKMSHSAGNTLSLYNEPNPTFIH